MRILGIDEAGRGCVLGALYVGAFLYEGPDLNTLWQAGAADSKRLSAKKRDAVREKLELLGRWTVRAITPAQIDAGNLNTLEETVIAELVREFQPDAVVLDALGHPRTLAAATARIQRASGVEATWTMEPKADQNHAVVAAASIFAKTERDAALWAIQGYGPLGSGYPSDPVTRRFLSEWAASERPWPAFVRTKWATLQRLAKPEAGGLWEGTE